MNHEFLCIPYSLLLDYERTADYKKSAITVFIHAIKYLPSSVQSTVCYSILIGVLYVDFSIPRKEIDMMLHNN